MADDEVRDPSVLESQSGRHWLAVSRLCSVLHLNRQPIDFTLFYDEFGAFHYAFEPPATAIEDRHRADTIKNVTAHHTRDI